MAQTDNIIRRFVWHFRVGKHYPSISCIALSENDARIELLSQFKKLSEMEENIYEYTDTLSDIYTRPHKYLQYFDVICFDSEVIREFNSSKTYIYGYDENDKEYRTTLKEYIQNTKPRSFKILPIISSYQVYDNGHINYETY